METDGWLRLIELFSYLRLRRRRKHEHELRSTVVARGNCFDGDSGGTCTFLAFSSFLPSFYFHV
jgi:hypothetical protein